ncbi:Zinc finger, C3HC-like [Melia azedarach]|uniref:Zinc finger, C3HC-like n=1 Tax=Melia azedarach TaxID=155640 RepID=A0ACC1XPH6_MELAZ|nr:Zinc finger, C3HC-like [Melia azedarach]
MAQDSEKRFHSIMDKLFLSPKSTPSSSSCSGVESRRGTKRPNSESILALVEPKGIANVTDKYQHSSASAESSEAPLCKPWDRGDLMRRLATFKSMTWFAKPKAVSAVNCARRGWVNVDTDTIACESCGARLLFSTPSSWPKHQVEKVALVFSLKLNNGHKLLCPWVDNICDETLAEFPPTTPPVLVDKFRERYSALLQLLALPVISPSAIEYMRSSQLDEFLRWSSIVEYGIESTKDSQTDSLGNEGVDNSPNLYYQAQKLISLCGWEPRSLPYVVDCEDGVNKYVRDVNGQNPSINVHSAVSNEIIDVTENSGAHNSIVLDCRLCGANVGLWAFSTIVRPVEFFRLVGHAEVNGQNNSGTHGSGNENHVDNREVIANTYSNGKPLCKESSSNLNMTIAGGPPPTKQNFKATISFPVIGRALRAKFSYDLDFRYGRFDNQEEIQSGARNENLLQAGKDHTECNNTRNIVQGEDTELLKSKVQDHGLDSSITDDQIPCSNLSEKGDTCGKENKDDMPVEGASVTVQDTVSETGTHCATTQNPTEPVHTVKVGQSQSDLLPENVVDVDPAAGKFGHLEVADNSITTADANLIIENGEHSKNERSLMISSYNAVVAQSPGTYPRKLHEETAMKFDPIRQHRHFCPWIVSTGSGSPGWQQTLSALLRQRKPSHLSPANSPVSSSIIKVDDPITSVRKLFMSPVPKRMKPTPESS